MKEYDSPTVLFRDAGYIERRILRDEKGAYLGTDFRFFCAVGGRT